MRYVITILSVLFFLISCNINNTEKFYYSQFVKYMQETQQQSEATIEYYYILHLQGCNSCIENSIKFLHSVDDSVKSKFLIVLVGEYIGNNMAYIKAIEALKEEYNCIKDYYQEIFKYQTGFAYPLFIHITILR